MRRRIKKNSGIYAFLHASGVLEHGTSDDIEKAKKQYWAKYRKKYKQIKRKESKSFEIFFNFKESRIIATEAKKYHTSPTNYIKQSALRDTQGIVDRVAIGEIRQLVIRHHNMLLELVEENKLPQPTGSQLLTQISLLEERILDFFLSLK